MKILKNILLELLSWFVLLLAFIPYIPYRFFKTVFDIDEFRDYAYCLFDILIYARTAMFGKINKDYKE